MINFENYTIRPLEIDDLQQYFILVERKEKDLRIFLRVQYQEQKI